MIEIDEIMKSIGYEFDGIEDFIDDVLVYLKEEEAAITIDLYNKTFKKENEYGPILYTKEELAAIDKICEVLKWGKEDINE